MHAPASLCDRDSLDAMTACFVIQLVSVAAVDFQRNELMPAALIRRAIGAVLSTLPGCQFEVGFGQLSNELFRIKATFGCPDFKNS
jgi:hypothetical protein